MGSYRKTSQPSAVEGGGMGARFLPDSGAGAGVPGSSLICTEDVGSRKADRLSDEELDEGAEARVLPDERDLKVMSDTLGRQLQAAYGELVKAPIPTRILDLLDQLDAKMPDGAEVRHVGPSAGDDEETPL